MNNDILFVIAYIIVGYDIVLKAVRNIFKGKVFDENFLMTVATIGAFCIGEFPEAAAVMLFYQVGESLLNTLALTGKSVPRKVTVNDEILIGCINNDGILKVKKQS